MAKILVIDDEHLVRASVEAILRGQGHDVILADNGREGLKHLRDGLFDLIVTDLIMPEMEGIETIQAIRRLPSSPKIIAISGGGRRQIGDFLDIARELGADRTLRKPFTADELIGAVNGALTATL